MMLVTTLEDTFLPHGAPGQEEQPDQHIRNLWRARYRAALARLQHAGIEITSDEQAGAEAYVSCRTKWDAHIRNLAPSMAYSMEEIDSALSGLGSQLRLDQFRPRLHVAE